MHKLSNNKENDKIMGMKTNKVVITMKFIDIHTHMLPNIDDGSKSIEMTLNMLRMSSETGTKKIVFTPHYFKYKKFPYTKEELQAKFNEVKELVKENNIDLEVYLGQEVNMFSSIVDKLEQKEILTINDSKYVLVEIPYKNAEPIKLAEEVIYDLKVSGFVPIIAHPERYDDLLRNPHKLSEWVEQGCLLQVNRESIMEKKAKSVYKFVHKLLKNQMVHFVASDSHRDNTRTPVLNDVYECISSQYGKDYTDDIFYNNQLNVLNNKDIVSKHTVIKKQSILEKMFG